jgi:hypothetical protein
MPRFPTMWDAAPRGMGLWDLAGRAGTKGCEVGKTTIRREVRGIPSFMMALSLLSLTPISFFRGISRRVKQMRELPYPAWMETAKRQRLFFMRGAGGTAGNQPVLGCHGGRFRSGFAHENLGRMIGACPRNQAPPSDKVNMYDRYPGGQLKLRPPRRWTWRWKTDCPAPGPTLRTVR